MITKNLTKKFALMIKIIISIMVLIPHTSFAVEQEVVLDSNIQYSEYTASTSGSENCKTPTDLNNPKEGECQVKRNKLEIGWKLTKEGDTCTLYANKLFKMIKMRLPGTSMDTDLPSIEMHRWTVECPTSEE